MFRKTGHDQGIGYERVMFAPFEIEVSQPQWNFRIRNDGFVRFQRPDRSEFFWSRPSSANGRGPGLVERTVNYQEVKFLYELGGPKFSTGTELPLRAVDPEFNDNSAGLGDINVTVKTVLIDGRIWQLTQMMRTYFATGVARRGLGTGHIAMEPAFLIRYKINPGLFVHSEVRFLYPLGAHPDHSGEVVRWGIGTSWVWYETDFIALLPTLELVGWSLLDGLESQPPPLPAAEVDSATIINVYPGMRIVIDDNGDFGLFEFGISGGVALTSEHLYESMLRIDLRWSH
jgi:hypothetical protein